MKSQAPGVDSSAAPGKAGPGATGAAGATGAGGTPGDAATPAAAAAAAAGVPEGAATGNDSSIGSFNFFSAHSLSNQSFKPPGKVKGTELKRVLSQGPPINNHTASHQRLRRLRLRNKRAG